MLQLRRMASEIVTVSPSPQVPPQAFATVFVEPTERLAAVDAAFAERNEER